jgi:hypothetical protein
MPEPLIAHAKLPRTKIWSPVPLGEISVQD